uniref:GTP-binding protein Rheb isoform 1 n=1 Tax=Entosiphon sulcatum TaxID=101493 RepID=A0A2R4IKU8_9EUGL|nr:GTP-binding protein Rheb isoform 1 [Entosiphon sulcatum]|eukprot:TRINITY_DN10005_c0_g1_i1.p1 TRINITY_DN10005_c0_g1~~TRINITY_DN10005_c0_g1_i1.p1  ORF type:complete len:261 (-),score=42.37 TRINITY_DN10005_c0_g1_i1:21-803(-)
MKRPEWKPNTPSCEACNKSFTLLVRPHHCRHCGGVFCDECTSSRCTIPKFEYTTPVRVCPGCFDYLQRETSGPQRAHTDSLLRQRKICILGYSAVGKSALTQQFVEDRFVQAYSPTITQTYAKRVKVRGEEFLLSVLDTAGQDECSLFQPQFSIGTNGYVLVYSINDRQSFEIVKTLRERIFSHAVDVVLLLVGNKSDLDKDRQVSVEAGKALAKEWDSPFMECTATKKEQVATVFQTVMEAILAHEEGGQRRLPPTPKK